MKRSEPHNKTRNLTLTRNGLLQRFSGVILYVLITVLVVSLYAGRYGFLESLTTRMQDGMLKLRGRLDARPSEIMIVGIDDRSLDNISGWPWPRDLLGQLIFLVAQGGPKVIGLDIFLPEDVDEDTSGRTGFLAEEIRAAANVLVPIYFGLSDAGIAPRPAPGRVKESAIDDTKTLRRGKASLLYARQLYLPAADLVSASAGFGHINIDYDPDGLVRREPLLINYDGFLYPSFGLRIASAYLDVRPDQIKPEGEGALKFAKTVVPTDKKQRMLVNYQGPNLSFERISAVDVFTGQVDPETFKGRIVLVGLTSTESKTWIGVPGFGPIDEVERIATVTHNIIRGGFLKHLSASWSIMLLVFIGIFCALILPNVSLTYRMVMLLVLLFVVFNFGYILFSSLGVLVKPVYPIIELLFFLGASPAIKPKQAREVASGASRPDAREAQSDEAEGQPSKLQPEEPARVPVSGSEGERVTQPERELTDYGLEAPPGSPSEPSADQTVRMDRTPKPDSTSEMTPTPLALGKEPSLSRFGRYQIIEVLGRGGMGAVYKGLDPVLDRPVALKTIRLDFALSPSEIGELRKRLVQEAKAAGRLSHPNIVTIYDVGEQGGLQYIAMEYLSGYTLDHFIKRKGVLNYRIVAKIILQTCDALSYAHRHGVVHRDVKPANIMLLDDFHVKVMDFGIARLETASLTRSNVALGTPYYVSPEQLDGRPADKRSDIFSLGVVIYELLTGRKPFQSENLSSLMYRILNHEPPPPSSIDEKAPLVFDRVVSKAMAKRPEDRYHDAEEIGGVMKEFVSSFVVSRSVRV